MEGKGNHQPHCSDWIRRWMMWSGKRKATLSYVEVDYNFFFLFRLVLFQFAFVSHNRHLPANTIPRASYHTHTHTFAVWIFMHMQVTRNCDLHFTANTENTKKRKMELKHKETNGLKHMQVLACCYFCHCRRCWRWWLNDKKKFYLLSFSLFDEWNKVVQHTELHRSRM